MKTLIELLTASFVETIQILDPLIPIDKYCLLNLSLDNNDLIDIDITDPLVCQSYIDDVLHVNNAKVAFGGYLEQRNIYKDKASFNDTSSPRNIHLGIDFWTAVGTKVMVPLKGRVHSYQNNAAVGDYGPTIILEHQIEEFVFYTLYGHLSLESLDDMYIGKAFDKSDCIGNLGDVSINVNYAPHLHFQIIIDMEGKKGDYPGACTADTLDYHAINCPNPNLLLQF